MVLILLLLPSRVVLLWIGLPSNSIWTSNYFPSSSFLSNVFLISQCLHECIRWGWHGLVEIRGHNKCNTQMGNLLLLLWQLLQKKKCAVSTLRSLLFLFKQFLYNFKRRYEPGYIHSTVMTGLQPSSTYTYRYGRCNFKFHMSFSFLIFIVI